VERARVELARYRCFLLGLPEELLPDTPKGMVDVMMMYDQTLRKGFDDATCGELVRATLAAYLPASGKPSDGEQQVMIAALPEPRPTLDAPKGAAGNSEAALARAEAKEMVDERLARRGAAPSAAPRLALISRDEGTDPAEIMGAGPRTTAKGGRPTVADEKPDPRSITIPVPQQVARWALSNEPVRLDTRGTRAPSFAHAFVRSAPQVVYTAGFQAASIGDINRFSGPAVVFLSVARFQTN
jgi:hypothetical protein